MIFKIKYVALLFLTCFFTQVSFAQNKSNRGKEFWVAYAYNFAFAQNNQDFAIYISTEQAATVTVSVNGTGFTQTVTVPANTIDATIIIPKSGINDARILSDGLSNKGIHIVSDVPIAAYAHQYATQISNATMLMPVETYGYTYYSINYYQTTSATNPPDWYSFFYVVATEDNTKVEITPSDSTKNGWLPNQTYTVTLNKGEVYNVFGKANFNGPPSGASKDMTGSKMVSVAGSDGKCHPIGVYSGASGIRLCLWDGGENMMVQVFPANAWGTRYLTHHTINNANSNISETFVNFYRVCVKDPTTIVKRNGIVMTGLKNNFFYDYVDSTGGDYIEADKPVLVAQYTPNKNQCWNYNVNGYGDPEMFYLSPLEQGQKNILFYVTRKTNIDFVYANFIVPTTAINSLKLDGVAIPAASTKPHPNLPSYSVAFARILGAAAQHSITCDSAINGIVYGLGVFESYGYNVGCLVNNLNAISEFKNKYNSTGLPDSVTCPKTPFRITVKLAYQATSINWKLSQAGGVVPNTDTLVVNPIPVSTGPVNGRTYYTYTLPKDLYFTAPGTYYIPVAYTSPDVDACNNSDTAILTVVVKPGPVADFTSTAQGCLPTPVSFTGTAIANGFNITSYLWNFDDNTTANTQNTIKVFNTAGNHLVKYSIITDAGCSHDTTKVIPVYNGPMANFGVNTPICIGDSARITDSSSIAQGTIKSWQWDFGDGTTATYSNNNPFYHKYPNTGTYTISLAVNADNNCKSADTAKKTILVTVRKVAAKFGYDNASICKGDSVKFIDSSSVVQGSVDRWDWDFGDGTKATYFNNQPFYHKYITPGSYQVVLVASSNSSCNLADTAKHSIVVNPIPVAKFVTSGNICQGDSVKITDSSFVTQGDITQWQWDFGDGTKATYTNGNPFYHKYTVSGNFTISLTVSSNSGCKSTNSALVPILVTPAPVARFGTGGNVCLGDSIKFIDSSTIAQGTITSWKWDFGDGSSATFSSNKAFYHTYASAGSFTVTLSVTGNTGCPGIPFAKIVAVNTKPNLSFTFSGTPCIDSVFTFTSSVAFNANNPATWFWDFGDGQKTNITSINTASHAYATNITNITVKHAVSFGVGCGSDTLKQIIPIINPNPAAQPFTVVGDTLCEKKPLLFTAPPNPLAATWIWNFGNGTGNNIPPFTHVYNTAGTYSPSLVIKTAAGCGSLPYTAQTIAIKAAPLVNAGPDKAIKKGESVTLGATVANTNNYSLLWSPVTYLNNPAILQPTATPDVTTTYTLTVMDNTALCSAADNVTINVFTKLYIPNAFSPNGDGNNDLWILPGIALYPNAIVTIFNRWGQKVYQSNDYYNNPWNGKFKGTDQPSGTYAYFIRLAPDNNQILKGMVNIVR